MAMLSSEGVSRKDCTRMSGAVGRFLATSNVLRCPGRGK